MWPKLLKEITYDDIHGLVEDHVSESRHLEYKRDLPGNTEAGKQRFLLAIAAFANAGGGYLIYGIDGKDSNSGHTGVASNIVPIAVDADKLIVQLESIVRVNIHPRVYVEMRAVSIPSDRSSNDMSNVDGTTVELNKYVLVVRIPSSTQAPHGVVVNEAYRFPVRVSSATQNMDMHEIRTAIVRSESALQRIERFIRQRYEKHRVTVRSNGISVLHILPLNLEANLDIIAGFTAKRDPIGFLPLRSGIPRSGLTQRYNLEGFCSDATSNGKTYSRTQVFRDGKIESVVRGWCVNNVLDVKELVAQILKYIPKYVEELETEINPFPLVISLALNLQSEAVFSSKSQRHTQQVGQEDVILPHVLLTERPIHWPDALRPMFDVLWNAFGLERCEYYDKNGNWEGNINYIED